MTKLGAITMHVRWSWQQLQKCVSQRLQALEAMGNK